MTETGVIKTYHLNGKLQLECFNLDGKKNGLCKMYYSNGRLESELNYINDVLNGPFKQYFLNGDLSCEGVYKDDICIPDFYKQYNGNGKIIKNNEIFHHKIIKYKPCCNIL